MNEIAELYLDIFNNKVCAMMKDFWAKVMQEMTVQEIEDLMGWCEGQYQGLSALRAADTRWESASHQLGGILIRKLLRKSSEKIVRVVKDSVAAEPQQDHGLFVNSDPDAFSDELSNVIDDCRHFGNMQTLGNKGALIEIVRYFRNAY